jgi:hypothetical protein
VDQKTYLRQFISDYLKGTNFEALLGTIADEAQRREDLSISIRDQLYFSTASGDYADRVFSQVGITRPPELGMEDLAFQQMGIQINAQKQITEVLHSVLETFFGDDVVRAFAQSNISEPYILADGDLLLLEIETGEVLTIPFAATDFLNITQATAKEVADVISRFTRSQGINAYATAYNDITTHQTFVRVFGSARGPYSMVRVIGGEIQKNLEFPAMRPTKLAVNNTIWEVTRTVGSTLRFRWYSGPQPLLSKVFIGDSALMYGSSFVNNGLSGTFTLTNVRPSQLAPSYDSGWFEIDLPTFQGLRSSIPDAPPLPNTPTDTYTILISQSTYDDLKFFLPKKNVPYNQSRYALAFEPKNNLLKIFLPATTKVVRRGLIGSAHLHPLYDIYNLDGVFGDLASNALKVEILNERAIRYPQNGYDNIGYGGTLTHGLNTISVDYVSRSNGYTIVQTTAVHGLIGDKQWLPANNYVIGDLVYLNNAIWVAIQNSGASYGGARTPDYGSPFWRFKSNGQNFCSSLVNIEVADIMSEDSLNPYKGPYVVDPEATYALTDKIVSLREKILMGTKLKTLFVDGVLTGSGQLLFGLNTLKQEGPVKYYSSQIVNAPPTVDIVSLSQNGFQVTVTCNGAHGAIAGSQVQISGISTVPSLNGVYLVDSVPSATVYQCTALVSAVHSVVNEGVSATILAGSAATLVLDPSYTFKNTHAIGTDVTLLSDRKAYVPAIDGSDYSFYLTGTTEGRTFCEDLLTQITALGIKLEIVIGYPYGVGFGNGLEPISSTTKNNDVEVIWG